MDISRYMNRDAIKRHLNRETVERIRTDWRWRPFLKGAGVLVALQFVLFGLLIVGQAVPDKPIVDNLVSSIENNTYGPSGIPDRMGTQSDTFTECVVVGTGLGASPDESALSRAARMPRIDNCAGGKQDILDLAEGKVFEDNNYYKYWAGYTILTRPLLATVGLEGLRIVAGALMITALFAAILLVRSKTSTAVAVALFLPFVVGTNMLSTPSTSFSQSIAITFIFLSVILTVVGFTRSTYLGLLGAGVGAALFCYVDLLTTPSIPWAMSAFVLAAAVWFQDRNMKRTATWGVLAAVVWPAAFGLTWVFRWIFGAVFMGIGETIAMVQQNVGFRTGGSHSGVSDVFGAGVASNVVYWWEKIPTAPFVFFGCLIAAAIALALAGRRGGVQRLKVAGVLALPMLIPAFWYIVVSNHSQIHEFFVNRGVPVALAVLTAACWAAAVNGRSNRVEEALVEQPQVVSGSTSVGSLPRDGGSVVR